MKNEMNNENMNILNDENLEEVSGGFSNRHPRVGGYADGNDGANPVLDTNPDEAKMTGAQKRFNRFNPKHPVTKGTLGEPIPSDTNNAESN